MDKLSENHKKLLDLTLPSFLSLSKGFEPLVPRCEQNLHFSLTLLGSLKILAQKLLKTPPPTPDHFTKPLPPESSLASRQATHEDTHQATAKEALYALAERIQQKKLR
jgi:hypothetical protein